MYTLNISYFWFNLIRCSIVALLILLYGVLMLIHYHRLHHYYYINQLLYHQLVVYSAVVVVINLGQLSKDILLSLPASAFCSIFELYKNSWIAMFENTGFQSTGKPLCVYTARTIWISAEIFNSWLCPDH